ncbi:hypothetical protein J6590_021000 [Homalodisca vitripennis]|nr:hypothetical protein J6590_021000 [Homalodisca vitripennis]
MRVRVRAPVIPSGPIWPPANEARYRLIVWSAPQLAPPQVVVGEKTLGTELSTPAAPQVRWSFARKLYLLLLLPSVRWLLARKRTELCKAALLLVRWSKIRKLYLVLPLPSVRWLLARNARE